MNILATQYTLNNQALEFYVSGCKGPHCTGCFNPETWEFDQGELFDDKFKQKIKEKVNDFDDMIEKFMIFGGEPLDQNHDDLKDFLKFLKSFNKEIWLFTRFEFKNVPRFVKENCDYIKCGRYVKDLETTGYIKHGIELASTNQKLYKRGKNGKFSSR